MIHAEHRSPQRDDRDACAATCALLVPYVDGELEPEEALAVESHLAACATCSLELRAHASLRDALRTSGGALPDRLDAGLANRVRVLARRGARRWRLGWAAAAAAAVIIFALLPQGSDPLAPGATGPVAPEEVIAALDVLEALDAQGVEPTVEVARFLLEDENLDLVLLHESLWGDEEPGSVEEEEL